MLLLFTMAMIITMWLKQMLHNCLRKNESRFVVGVRRRSRPRFGAAFYAAVLPPPDFGAYRTARRGTRGLPPHIFPHCKVLYAAIIASIGAECKSFCKKGLTNAGKRCILTVLFQIVQFTQCAGRGAGKERQCLKSEI